MLLAKKRLVSLLLVAWLSGLRAASAQFYWSADTTSQGGTGTWSAAGVNWGAAAGGPYTLANSGNGNNSFFGGTAGTVTVSGSVNNRSLQFDVPGYVITGGTLFRNVTPNGIIVTGALGNDATIDSNFMLPSGGRVLKQGANTITLNGTNDRGTNVEAGTIIAGVNARIGITTVNSGATLVLDSGQSGNLRLAGGAAAAFTMNAGGTLASSNASGITISAATFSGAGIFNFGNATYTGGIEFTPDLDSTVARTWNVAANTTVTFSGDLTGDAGSYTKDGSGTVILAGANNTYTGGTTISAGTLLANNTTGSATGTGNVTVNGGTLGGDGIISGATAIASGGTVAPGNSIGNLTINNTLGLSGTALFEINDQTGQADLIAGVSTLTFGGTLTVTNLGNESGYFDGQQFNLFDFTAGSGTFATINLPALPGGLEWKDFGGQQFDYATGIIQVVTAIPEPGTLIYTSLGLAMLWAFQRRRTARVV